MNSRKREAYASLFLFHVNFFSLPAEKIRRNTIFALSRNTFAMFVQVEMSDYRTCKTHSLALVLIQTVVTRRGYRIIPQCRA
jgi:hypothetical protein